MKTEAYKSVCARLFGGGEGGGERKISLTFDLENLCVSTLLHIPIWLIFPLCVRYTIYIYIYRCCIGVESDSATVYDGETS